MCRPVSKTLALTFRIASHFQLKIELAGVDKSAKGREVWLLLTRHVVDTRRTGEFIALSVQQHDGVVNMRDMSLKAGGLFPTLPSATDSVPGRIHK